MRKTNDTYCVVFRRGARTVERYYRDKDGWLKVSSRGSLAGVPLPYDAQNLQLEPVSDRVAYALDIVLGSHNVRVTRDGGHSWQTIEPVLVK